MASVDRLSEIISVHTTIDVKHVTDTNSDNVKVTIYEEDSDGVNKYLKTYFRLDNCMKQLQEQKKLLENEKIIIRQRKQKNKDLMYKTDEMLLRTKSEYMVVKQYHADLKHKSDLHMQQFNYRTQKLNRITNEIATLINDIKKIDINNKITSIKLITPDVDKSVTDRIENDTITDEQFGQLCRSAIMGESLKEAVREIEERHSDILKLEQSVLEVYELFKDLAVLIDSQQEIIDNISLRISNAKNHVMSAEKDLVRAEKEQKKGRNYKCFALICCLIILLIVLIPVLNVAFKSA